MAGFEQQTSGVRNDRFANLDTTTAPIVSQVLCSCCKSEVICRPHRYLYQYSDAEFMSDLYLTNLVAFFN